jgi:hypothetical protein
MMDIKPVNNAGNSVNPAIPAQYAAFGSPRIGNNRRADLCAACE